MLARPTTCSSVGLDGAASAAHLFGRRVRIGVPLVTADWTRTPPPKTCWSQTRSASTPTASLIKPEPVFTASRAATSRPSAVATMSTPAGEAEPTSVGQQLGLRRDQVAVVLGRLGDVDLGGTVARQGPRLVVLLDARAAENRRRLTQPAGRGQQLDPCPSSSSPPGCSTRTRTSAHVDSFYERMAPLCGAPSELPGGRKPAATAVVVRRSRRPTSAAAAETRRPCCWHWPVRPRRRRAPTSARDIVVKGFFFAAMMPLKEG